MFSSQKKNYRFSYCYYKSYAVNPPACVCNLLTAVDLTFMVIAGLRVFSGPYGWGWPYFVGLKELKDPSRGYLVGSKCVIRADLTIVGSSTDGKM
jgi:hypothetical protein